jgi:signal peptidase I
MPPPIAAQFRSPLRFAIEAAVFVLAGLIFLWGFLLLPCRVVGDSMGERLPGRHCRVLCADCGAEFACGIEDGAASRAVCPNCGYPDNMLAGLPEHEGARVVINRAAFQFRRPRRWELVALRDPLHAERILVKRVVGLPGERIELRGGDVFADGQICRKNLAQQRDMAILVHDAAHNPIMSPVPWRWQPTNTRNQWIALPSGFEQKGNLPSEPSDWLVYRHWRREGDKTVESPITDICGYNQSRPRREEDVHPVPDLMLRFYLTFTSPGELYVRADDGRHQYMVCLKWNEGKLGHVAYIDGNGWLFSTGRESRLGRRRLVEVSLIDRCFLLVVDGQTWVELPFEHDEAGPPPPAAPLAIGARGAKIEELRVYRDVYYTRPPGTIWNQDARASVQLGADEYFVLGDNSPVSQDSRHWDNGGAVEAKFLLGKPL